MRIIRKEKNMNKLFTKIATLSVGLFMAIGVGVATGNKSAKVERAEASEEVAYTLDGSIPGTGNSYTGNNTATQSGVSWIINGNLTMNPWRIGNGKSASAGTRIVQSQGAVSSENISKIEINTSTVGITPSAITLKVGTSAGDGSITNTSTTWETPKKTIERPSGADWTGRYFEIGFTIPATASKYFCVNSIIFYYEQSGPVTTYTITYDSNGGSGTMEDTVGANPAVATCTFTAPSGKMFDKWNTQADGNGTDYAVDATPKADLDLFAIWKDKPVGADYTLFTDALEEGDYVIVYDGAAMKASVSSKRLEYDEVTIVDDAITNPDASLVWHIEPSGDYWTMYNESVSKYAGSTGSKNQAALLDSVSDNAKWSEEGTGTGTFDFINLARSTGSDSGNKYLRKNGTFGFACYASGTGGEVSLYKKSEATGKNMKVQDNYHNDGPFEATYGDTSEYKYLLGWDIDGDTALNSGCTWTVSDDSIIDYYSDGYTWLNWKPKNVGTTTVTCSHDGFKDASTTITVVPGTLSSIVVSGSMTKTSYYVGESWNPAGLVATANYDSGYSAAVTDQVSWSYNPAAPALLVDSVVATATYNAVSGNSSAQAVSVTKTNPIQVLYTKASGASVDVYGYYVGFLDGTGPVIMDGEYGIVIYNKTADVSGYTEKETILHVTGSISIYKGLYEIGSASISVASGTYDAPSAPVVYATAGGETADYASRLTTVTGTPSLVSGSFDDAAGTNDIKLSFNIGLSSPIQVFYKKAAQTADATAFADIKAAVANSEEITIKGFTGWYDGFQVQMNGVVEAKEDYTAEDFAEDLLAQTDAVCKDWEEGVNNHDAIEAIWSDLASDDKYPSLPADQKAILASAARNPSGTTVEQAMARYDFLTGKYKLSNFINGRTPVGMNNYVTPITEGDNNTAIIVIVSISAISVLSIAVLLTLKKRKLR